MASKRTVGPKPISQAEREARMQRVVSAIKKNKKIMDGVRESLEARARGDKGITLEELKKQMGE